MLSNSLCKQTNSSSIRASRIKWFIERLIMYIEMKSKLWTLTPQHVVQNEVRSLWLIIRNHLWNKSKIAIINVQDETPWNTRYQIWDGIGSNILRIRHRKRSSKQNKINLSWLLTSYFPSWLFFMQKTISFRKKKQRNLMKNVFWMYFWTVYYF